MPDPLTGKLDKAEIEEHLTQGEKFDSYFKPPANLPIVNGNRIALPGLEIPLWSSPARAAHDAGTLHVFSMDIPDEMRRNKASNAPAKIRGKNPYIAISVSSFYRLSLLCQAIDNWTPPRDELSGPIPFDILGIIPLTHVVVESLGA